MPIVSRLVIVEPPEALDVITHDNIEPASRFFSIADHLLECSSSKCTSAADGIVNIEFGKSETMLSCIFTQGLFLINVLFAAESGREN